VFWVPFAFRRFERHIIFLVLSFPLNFLFEEATIDSSFLFGTGEETLPQRQVFAYIVFIRMIFHNLSCPIMPQVVYFGPIIDVLSIWVTHIHA